MKESVKQESHFTIDDKNYLINESETHWSIGSLSRSLITQIVITATDIQADINKGLLDEYCDNGRIKLSMEAMGIFNNGIPTGIFHYKEDKNEETYTYMWKDGTEYQLDFFGMVSYADSWVLIKGELKPPYDSSPVFLIDAAIKFDYQTLDWSQYKFKSLEETLGADKTQVRFLEITNPTFRELPEDIYAFVNLEYLAILNKSNFWNEEKLALNELGNCLGDLKCLREIFINKASISSLPTSFGQLQHLEVLNLSSCKLNALPDAIWTFPHLKYLFLSNNHISTIPESLDLPSLSSLNIENNHLKTLPESLVMQSKIRTIKASGNPFESLPDRFSFFRGLDLTIQEKKKLLDMTYRGADGLGTIDWNDRIYYAETDTDLTAPIQNIIKNNKLGKHKKALLSLIKKSVGFCQTTEENYTELGNHRFGGKPDLPDAVLYPTFFDKKGNNLHYEFIAQINCEQIAPLQEYLPRKGCLFFFLKSFHFLGEGDDIARVIYVEDNTLLTSATRFNLKSSDFFELESGQYDAFKAEANTIVSFPSLYAIEMNSYLLEGKAKSLQNEEDHLEDLYDRFEKPVEQLHLFDHASNVYGFTQHESPELQAALTYKGNPQDWIVLLEVKSRGSFMWSDAGDLFFVIHKSDLAKKDFSRIFVTMESS